MRVFSVLVLFVVLSLFMAGPGYAETIAETRAKAEQGDTDAQFKLGLMYCDGQGVPQDYKQAVAWYLKAAEQGFARAQVNLGVMYANGQGVPQDDKQAVAWWRKAAEQGFAEAQGWLGGAYCEGHGVTQDYAQACMWLNLAAAQGDETAIKLRDLVVKALTPSQIEEGQRLAREWLAAHPQADGGETP